ncbi:hypothetical protein DEO72_LG8g1134 [Vigna unguiculata]|uniref:Uncharacterized protein n=1 Tax=Vigna unguiculata TaxID=3917 RepID=A0A4D6MP11_VIGUN|nr:hypothetical protein DEO72_LG8g1134 [Vigna unguiculata]
MLSPSFLVFFFACATSSSAPLLRSTTVMRTAPPPLAVQAAVATVVRSTTTNPCPRNPSFGHAAALVWNSASTAWPRRWSSIKPVAPPSAASLRLGFGQSVAPVAAVVGSRAAALPPPQHRVVEVSLTSFVASRCRLVWAFKEEVFREKRRCSDCHLLLPPSPRRWSSSAAPVAVAAGPRAAALPPPLPLPPRLPFVAATLCWLFRAVTPWSLSLIQIKRCIRDSYPGGSTMHTVPMLDDLVRVVVEDIRDATAPVPMPTEEDPRIRKKSPIVSHASLEPEDEPELQPLSHQNGNPIQGLIVASSYLYQEPFPIP